MNLHKNATTCPKSRALMVSRVLEDGRPVVVVAEEFGVSRRTVYKWVQRYCEAGEVGLGDGSSKPGVLRHQLGQDWVQLIVELRTAYRMTALRIANQLKLSRSTVAAVLQREGLSQLKKVAPPEPVVRYEHDGPGEMLHLDIKKLGRCFTQAPLVGIRVMMRRKKTASWRAGLRSNALTPSPTGCRSWCVTVRALSRIPRQNRQGSSSGGRALSPAPKARSWSRRAWIRPRRW